MGGNVRRYEQHGWWFGCGGGCGRWGRYARVHGHEAAVRLQRAMNDTVGEVVRVAGAEGFGADIHQGGVCSKSAVRLLS